jgi:hypothetical protein
VWVAGDGTAYAAGDNGTLLQYTAGRWRAYGSGTTNSIRGLSGTSANNLLAVGDLGQILHGMR